MAAIETNIRRSKEFPYQRDGKQGEENNIKKIIEKMNTKFDEFRSE